jgi:mRNA-degrading endonuclease RelE of RelBE toxin-antitoxin system
MNSEVYLSAQFKKDLEELPLTEQKQIAEIVDLLEKDAIANSRPVNASDPKTAGVREARKNEVRLLFRYVPEESAVILTGLQVGTALNDRQVLDIAQLVHDIAVQVGQIRLNLIREGARLTDPGIVQLQGYVYSLMTTAGNYALQVPNIALRDSDVAMSAITVALSKAASSLKKPTDLDWTIVLASGVIVLAMAISTRDIGQILNAAKSLSKTAENLF